MAGIPFLFCVLSLVQIQCRANSLAASPQSISALYLLINSKHCHFCWSTDKPDESYPVFSSRIPTILERKGKNRVDTANKLGTIAAGISPCSSQSASAIYTPCSACEAVFKSISHKLKFEVMLEGMFITPLASHIPDLCRLWGWFIMRWAVNSLTSQQSRV